MAQLNDLIVNGETRILGDTKAGNVYSNNTKVSVEGHTHPNYETNTYRFITGTDSYTMTQSDLSNYRNYYFAITNSSGTKNVVNITIPFSYLTDQAVYTFTVADNKTSIKIITQNDTSGDVYVHDEYPNDFSISSGNTDYRFYMYPPGSTITVFRQGTTLHITGNSIAGAVQVIPRVSLSGSGSTTHDEMFTRYTFNNDAEYQAQSTIYRFTNGGSAPFNDGMCLNIPWHINYGRQIAFEDENHAISTRVNSNGWSSWKPIINAQGVFQNANKVVDLGDTSYKCYLAWRGDPVSQVTTTGSKESKSDTNWLVAGYSDSSEASDGAIYRAVHAKNVTVGRAAIADAVSTNGKTNNVEESNNLCLTSQGAYANLLRKGACGVFFAYHGTQSVEANRMVWQQASVLAIEVPAKGYIPLTFSFVASDGLSTANVHNIKFVFATSISTIDSSLVISKYVSTNYVNVIPLSIINNSNSLVRYHLFLQKDSGGTGSDTCDINAGMIWGTGGYGQDLIPI